MQEIEQLAQFQGNMDYLQHSSLGFKKPDECCVGKWVEGEVSHLEEDGVFWLQTEPSKAKELGEQLDEEVEVLTTTQIKEGAAVVATWGISPGEVALYRGEVTRLCDNEELEVHFVDYGNSDVLQKSKVRPAAKGELALPPLAQR